MQERVSQETSELPDDPALPGLRNIRTEGIASVISDLEPETVTLWMRNYVPGSRAILEARIGDRRFAIKIYADDPSAEAEVYQQLALAGLAGDSGPRVPRLLNWVPDQKTLVLSWLEGPSLRELVNEGKGRRAGELAAAWLRATSSLGIGVGPLRACGYFLDLVGTSVAAVAVADPSLGALTRKAAEALIRAQPEEEERHLVHGTFYARHILDTGDGPGIVDWQQCGQGPIEADAGMFLATISRLGLHSNGATHRAEQAKDTFMEGTRELVDPNSLKWYWSASLVHLAGRGLARGRKTHERTEPLLQEAVWLAEHSHAPHPIEMPAQVARGF